MAGRAGSLSTRLLVITAVMLVAAFGGTSVVLDFIFRRSAEEALVDQLETQVFALIGAVEPDDAGNLTIPDRLLEPRLANPGSGLYAEILDASGLPLWRSPSAVGLDLATGETLKAGQRTLTRRGLADGTRALLLGVAINWELGPSATPAFQVFAAADLAASERQLTQFRRQLAGWFSGVMLVLLAALWLAVRFGLRPLRLMSSEISEIEEGRREALSEEYPRELAGVGRGFNTLLRSERQRMERYRTTMDDLAHSLKTPLAVVRNEIGGPQPDRATLTAQVERMQSVIDYQLKRAAAMGPRSLAAKAVPLEPVLTELVASLRKIHRDRAVACELHVPDGASYPAEQGDLYEILGNLLDNAWKWCREKIVVTVRTGDLLEVSVEDDGPGIPEDQTEAVLNRGIRADQRGDVPGQGIGLAVVREIVGLYGGRLQIGRSPLGGAAITVSLKWGQA
ncbi:MAG: two-component sensor histidine kinase [Gammaproteobacteria bacterium]|nr:two-component sensor histidine kinase [Gammaproteobacteria bacterium]